MVLRWMISPYMLAVLGAGQTLPLPSTFDLVAAKSVARSILTAGSAGLAGGVTPTYIARDPLYSVKTDTAWIKPRTVVTLSWGGGTTVVFDANTKILDVDPSDTNVLGLTATSISQTQAIALAGNYYTLATGLAAPSIVDASLSNTGTAMAQWWVRFTPTSSGIPYTNITESTVIVDANTGQLCGMSTPPAYAAPSSVPTTVTPDQATAALAGATLDVSGIASVVAIGSPKLEWSPLFTAPAFKYWNPAYAAAAESNQVVLWYGQSFYDAASYDSSSGEYGTHYTAYIDASTGRTIAVTIGSESISSSSPQRRSTTRAWDLGPGATNVWSNQQNAGKRPEGGHYARPSNLAGQL